ncbi:MAG: hypothetical protein HY873_13285 [Chloroflexi bacterium]|nr:hypothetical protein [Chloroflexota bacterium]
MESDLTFRDLRADLREMAMKANAAGYVVQEGTDLVFRLPLDDPNDDPLDEEDIEFLNVIVHPQLVVALLNLVDDLEREQEALAAGLTLLQENWPSVVPREARS